MPDVKLGEKIVGNAERDAVHLAIVPLVAGEDRLYPGCGFKLAFGTSNTALKADSFYGDKVLGIIDPFLNIYRIDKGDKIWGCLYPNTVTGMRHHWQHPSFDNVRRNVNEHELWIRQFCDRWNFNYDELISAALKNDPEWNYVVARGIDLHSAIQLGEDEPLFWSHLEGLTGKKFNQEHRENMGWSCSC